MSSFCQICSLWHWTSVNMVISDDLWQSTCRTAVELSLHLRVTCKQLTYFAIGDRNPLRQGFFHRENNNRDIRDISLSNHTGWRTLALRLYRVGMGDRRVTSSIPVKLFDLRRRFLVALNILFQQFYILGTSSKINNILAIFY